MKFFGIFFSCFSFHVIADTFLKNSYSSMKPYYVILASYINPRRLLEGLWSAQEKTILCPHKRKCRKCSPSAPTTFNYIIKLLPTRIISWKRLNSKAQWLHFYLPFDFQSLIYFTQNLSVIPLYPSVSINRIIYSVHLHKLY